MRPFLLLSALLLAGYCSFGQSAEDAAIELNAVTQVSPPLITLHWKKITFGSPSYAIYKKAKTATSWGTAIAVVPATDSLYADAVVVADSAYEYQVLTVGGSLSSSGYIYAGIKCPAVHNRGALLLLVDSAFSGACAFGIGRLMDDISGDGWQIIRQDINRARPDTFVKAVITATLAAHADLRSVFILGHLAVPYSALFNVSVNPPDGHVPDHNGAWPADVFYACSGSWTDAGTETGSSHPANWNIPADGKWDQYGIPSPAALQVGRVDFYDMPAFGGTEVLLMNRYLLRDHEYKADLLDIIHRGLINDNFGYFSGEAFAANGWRNFAPLVGRDSVHVLPLITTLSTQSYQWAYACGGGTFTSAGGVGTTADFAANPENGIFTMMFGSYFGDWNVQDNFLRAPLCASTPALTNCWAGRPNWFFHHMALGENIGYAASLAQNNNGLLYQPSNYGAQSIHVALMGDPTLRTDYIKPISHITITKPFNNGAILSWTASPDPGVLGYYVYRADSAYGYFQRLSGLLSATTYHDLTGHNGYKFYMVRPVKLQSTPSGGYYNLGIGLTDTATVIYAGSLGVAAVAPLQVAVFPNPAESHITATISAAAAGQGSVAVTDAAGRQVYYRSAQMASGATTVTIAVGGLAPGVYTLVVKQGSATVSAPWIKL